MKLLPISYQSNVSQNSNYLSKNNSKNYSSSTTFKSGKTCSVLNNIQPKQNNNVILDVLKLVLEHRTPGSGSQSSSNIYRSHSSYSHSSSKPYDYEKEAREINERIHKQSWDDYYEKNPSPTIGSCLMGP